MKPILPTQGINQMLLSLTKEETTDPIAILEEVCDEYLPGEIREYFTHNQEYLLTSDNYNSHTEREKLVLATKRLLRLVEACYLIVIAHHSKKTKDAA